MSDSEPPEPADRPRSKRHNDRDRRPKPAHDKPKKDRDKPGHPRSAGARPGDAPAPRHKERKADRRKHGGHSTDHVRHGPGARVVAVFEDAAETTRDTIGEVTGGMVSAGVRIPGGIVAVLGVAALGVAGMLAATFARGSARHPDRAGESSSATDGLPLTGGEIPDAVQTLSP